MAGYQIIRTPEHTGSRDERKDTAKQIDGGRTLLTDCECPGKDPDDDGGDQSRHRSGPAGMAEKDQIQQPADGTDESGSRILPAGHAEKDGESKGAEELADELHEETE